MLSIKFRIGNRWTKRICIENSQSIGIPTAATTVYWAEGSIAKENQFYAEFTMVFSFGSWTGGFLRWSIWGKQRCDEVILTLFYFTKNHTFLCYPGHGLGIIELRKLACVAFAKVMERWAVSSIKETTNSTWKKHILFFRLLAATVFRPGGARRAFPCFDEPHLRAPFRISVFRDRFHIGLSNSIVHATDDVGFYMGTGLVCAINEFNNLIMFKNLSRKPVPITEFI